MIFEIVEQDLAGRIGKLDTPHGTLETPLLFPVVNPTRLTIPPPELKREFKCPALITNAYFLWQRCHDEVLAKGIHDFLDFDGVIMTDSGAYQILVYGDVDIPPETVLEFQRQIGSDLGVILDIPTGTGINHAKAEKTVEETLRRARDAIKYWDNTPLNKVPCGRQDPLWVGPIQGGGFPDLVASSAAAMNSLGFKIFALGSPTPLLEQYLYPELIQMIYASRSRLPTSAPLHLFGAGHPMILPLAVAMGCDLFDSAAYVLFAKQDRYLAPNATLQLESLRETSCLCPICRRYTPPEILALGKEERTGVLARHNLYVTLAELQLTKQAIRDGRLWELIQRKAVAHPQLLEATRSLQNFAEYLERNTPVIKERGILYTGANDFWRPEVIRHYSMMKNWRPMERSVLVLLTPDSGKLGIYSVNHRRVSSRVTTLAPKLRSTVSLALLSIPFGLVPWELTGVYPLTQHVTIREGTLGEWQLATTHLTTILQQASQLISSIIVLGYLLPDCPVLEGIQRFGQQCRIQVKAILTEKKSDAFQASHLSEFEETLLNSDSNSQ